jgi:hypothetical protein
MGGIMLDEFSGIVGDNFPVMSFFGWFLLIKAMFLRPVNDGGKRYFLLVFFRQLILDIAIVVGSNREVGILDQGFFQSSSLKMLISISGARVRGGFSLGNTRKKCFGSV